MFCEDWKSLLSTSWQDYTEKLKYILKKNRFSQTNGVYLYIMTSDLWGVDGVWVVGVWEQIHVEAKRHVADGGDLILRRTSSVQKPGRRKLQLLQSVETQTLHERSFNLRHAGRTEDGRKSKEDTEERKWKKQTFSKELSYCLVLQKRK